MTIPHPNCGHTFCAICMLKHFFSRFHRTCGAWHEHVECPMCRSILIYTPNQLPRSLLTFPFAKNRMTDAAVLAMIEQLTNQIEGAILSCEGIELTKGGIKTDGPSLAVWRVGASSRMEWFERREYVSQLPIAHILTQFHTTSLTPWRIQKGKTYVHIRHNTLSCVLTPFSQRK